MLKTAPKPAKPQEAAKPPAPNNDALMLAVAKLQSEALAKALQLAVTDVVAAMERNRPADSLIVTLQHDRNNKLTGAIVRRGKSAP
jgi:hypothetical protein